jgi:NADH:ubiquinone oxidoreductase subunit 6 (subunit J)
VSAVLFFIAAIGALTGALGVVLLRNPFYSVLSLVVHLIALAALFLLLRAEFVAAAQVVVYAGAVMVLYVFVVSYIGGGDEPITHSGGALKVLGPLFGLALAIELCIAVLGSALKGIAGKGAPYVSGFGSPRSIGTLFLTKYLLPFELASLLLLVAAIGAVVLARRRRGLEPPPDEQLQRRYHPARSPFTGTLAEGVGLRPGAGTGEGEVEDQSERERVTAEAQPTSEGGW